MIVSILFWSTTIIVCFILFLYLLFILGARIVLAYVVMLGTTDDIIDEPIGSEMSRMNDDLKFYYNIYYNILYINSELRIEKEHKKYINNLFKTMMNLFLSWDIFYHICPLKIIYEEEISNNKFMDSHTLETKSCPFSNCKAKCDVCDKKFKSNNLSKLGKLLSKFKHKIH